mmetsp:Transcript_23957/g.71609  ORF Transcript_23957/g.71609 Transcript_23957/m.71609 type:complete len:224 (+) Transcript_23957:122-793(+)
MVPESRVYDNSPGVDRRHVGEGAPRHYQDIALSQVEHGFPHGTSDPQDSPCPPEILRAVAFQEVAKERGAKDNKLCTGLVIPDQLHNLEVVCVGLQSLHPDIAMARKDGVVPATAHGRLGEAATPPHVHRNTQRRAWMPQGRGRKLGQTTQLLPKLRAEKPADPLRGGVQIGVNVDVVDEIRDVPTNAVTLSAPDPRFNRGPEVGCGVEEGNLRNLQPHRWLW